jgi:MtN3 and saliva related transmembrane protein
VPLGRFPRTTSERVASHIVPDGGDTPGAPVMLDALGWVSSFILVLTIAKQVHKQWRDGSSEGVSKWLFIGQMAASVGFTIYSWGVGNWVFVATNAIMLLNGIVGYAIVLRHRRRAARTARAAG